KSPPGAALDGRRVISSDEALRLERLPASIVVIGAGAVGVEFADVFGAYGVRVTLVEALPRLLPLEDEELSRILARGFAKRGIDVRTGAKVPTVTPGKSGVAVELDHEGKAVRVEADQVLMAVGRGANIQGLGLETVGVALERGFIKVTPRMESSVPGVYAIGAAPTPPLPPHKPTPQLHAATHNI